MALRGQLGLLSEKGKCLKTRPTFLQNLLLETTMKNPFNQPYFQVTEDYINRCLAAATVPFTSYMINTEGEFPGELEVIVAAKDKFIDAEQAMTCLMQRMVVL